MRNLLLKSASTLRYRLRSVLYRQSIREASKLSLGDSGQGWTEFITAGLSGDIRLDIVGQLPGWMLNHYEFIWSERMLEHIAASDLQAVFQNIRLLLKDGARCRMCLPICFWGTQANNMVRAGNAANCARQGHITWFTHEGYGPITEACMGAPNPPEELVTTWAQGLKTGGLVYQPLRHYRRDGSLFVDESALEQDPATFEDEPTIKVKRPDSLIFDLIKTR